MPIEEVEQQARYLARDNRQVEPDIRRVYWFPNADEVRLIETLPSMPEADGDVVRPFYFRASPVDNLPAPSGIALIRPEEVARLQPPPDWGRWEDAVVLEPDEQV